MALRATFSGSRQILEELCEHCDEVVRELHISEITFAAEHDTRTIRMRDKDNELFTLKKVRERISEFSESFKRKGLLDDDEAEDAYREKKFKYGLRPEAMCSESIDIIGGVTQSFCYRVAENPDDVKFSKVVGGKSLSASFAESAESDTTGSRMGVDRKGRVIKLKEYKKINLQTGRADADSLMKYKGAHKTSWWRSVAEDRQKSYIERMQRCEAFQERYGVAETKKLTVVDRFRSEDELRSALEDSRCE